MMDLLAQPLPGFRFVVTLSPGDAYVAAAISTALPLVPEAAFQSVSGLSGELEVMPYAEGGVNDHLHQLPVRHSWGRITLKRGVVLTSGLWDWYQSGLYTPLGARRDGAIILLGQEGTPRMVWTFTGGLAAKWAGPDLDAMSDGVAVESLEIAHQGLVSISMSGKGGVGG